MAVATCFRRSMLLPASVALGAQPAEERPRSLALHLHLSMIPPQLLSSEAPKRALRARFGPRFRVVVPSNGPRS